MINTDLFYVLMGAPVPGHPVKNIPPSIAPRTTSQTMAARFLNEGYAVEFYEWSSRSHRVSWFWGPGEFIIPTSPYASVKMLEKGSCTQMNYGNMINLLRNNDEVRVTYKKLREEHNIAIAKRIAEIRSKTPLEVYVNLVAKKPWVLEQVSNEDLASYLNIDIETLKGFSNMKA